MFEVEGSRMLVNRGRRWLTAVIPIVAALSAIGCSGDQAGDITGPSGGTGGGNLSSASVTAADLAFCASETNRYRTSVGVGEVAQAADLEAFALAAARADHASGVEQAYFRANATGLAAGRRALRRDARSALAAGRLRHAHRGRPGHAGARVSSVVVAGLPSITRGFTSIRSVIVRAPSLTRVARRLGSNQGPRLRRRNSCDLTR
jgi:hypothetical protein